MYNLKRNLDVKGRVMKILPAIFIICVFFISGFAFAQNMQVYNDGEIDYVPMSAKIRLQAEDNESSVQYIEYSLNGQQIKKYNGPITFSNEGRNFIAYRAIDNTGNISKEKIYSYIVDGTPPSFRASTNGPVFMKDNTVYLTKDTTVVLLSEDELSGVQAIYVGLDDGGFWRYTGAASVEREGRHVGKAYAVDNVGNRTKTYSVTGYIDNTPPSVEIVPKNDLVTLQGSVYTNTKNQFSVRASDKIAGIDKIMVSVDRGEFFTYTEPIKIQKTGYHSIRAKAVDKLNNMSEPTEVTFYIDVKTPEAKVEVLID